MNPLDKSWHLSKDEAESKLTDFELQHWRVHYGFIRWQEECEIGAGGFSLTGYEIAILHAIRMRDTPKTITDICRLLNRNDTFNIRYSLNKLLKLGLIRKLRSSQGNKSYLFEATEAGIKDTEEYSKMRRNVIIKMLAEAADLNLEELSRNLIKIKAIYDEADRSVAFFKKPKKNITDEAI